MKNLKKYMTLLKYQYDIETKLEDVELMSYQRTDLEKEYIKLEKSISKAGLKLTELQFDNLVEDLGALQGAESFEDFQYELNEMSKNKISDIF